MKKLHLGLPKMPKKALLLAGVAIVLLVGLGGWLILKPSGTAKQAADSSSKGGSSASSGGLETLSLQANALNTARKNDISSIAAAINEIESNNNGVPPKSTSTNAALGMLVICGDDCFGTHAASIKLGQYANSADAVKYATYINTLAVPNINTVYIVNGATCKADNSGIGDKGLDRNVAILYALQTSSGIGPQCLAAS
ncbi:MAG: hypothetical protein JWN38_1028 [Candidatus Saccharibacteria bacterium]|nr:hypothetical protein [Candidatus Saccharibacteria bacterium]